MIATVLDKMAGLYADQKKWEQANQAIEQANAVRAHFMALGLTQAAGLKLMAGDMDGAKALYQRALVVCGSGAIALIASVWLTQRAFDLKIIGG